MYESIYRLSANPFRLVPDARLFFASNGHKRGLAYLRYGLHQGQGFVVVTGKPGTGKSTLVQTLFTDLSDESLVVAGLTSTNLEADDVLQAVGHSFDVYGDGKSKASLLIAIENFLKARARQGKRVVLIVDEAQNLPLKSLEELRMLSNFQLGEQPLLQIMLLGQQELQDMMARPELEQLAQRVIASCHLKPLDAEETRAYIAHRLQCVGWCGDPVISGEALALIWGASQGIPRLINIFCDRLFLAASLEEAHRLDHALAQSVLTELREEATGSFALCGLSLPALPELEPLPDAGMELPQEAANDPDADAQPVAERSAVAARGGNALERGARQTVDDEPNPFEPAFSAMKPAADAIQAEEAPEPAAPEDEVAAAGTQGAAAEPGATEKPVSADASASSAPPVATEASVVAETPVVADATVAEEGGVSAAQTPSGTSGAAEETAAAQRSRPLDVAPDMPPPPWRHEPAERPALAAPARRENRGIKRAALFVAIIATGAAGGWYAEREGLIALPELSQFTLGTPAPASSITPAEPAPGPDIATPAADETAQAFDFLAELEDYGAAEAPDFAPEAEAAIDPLFGPAALPDETPVTGMEAGSETQMASAPPLSAATDTVSPVGSSDMTMVPPLSDAAPAAPASVVEQKPVAAEKPVLLQTPVAKPVPLQKPVVVDKPAVTETPASAQKPLSVAKPAPAPKPVAAPPQASARPVVAEGKAAPARPVTSAQPTAAVKPSATAQAVQPESLAILAGKADLPPRAAEQSQQQGQPESLALLAEGKGAADLPPIASLGKEGAISDFELTELLYNLIFYYESGDLPGLLNLFTADAEADGARGAARIRKDYMALFEATEMRAMRVEHMDWEMGGEAGRGHGQFAVTVWRDGGKAFSQQGELTLDVVKRGDELLIRRMAHEVK